MPKRSLWHIDSNHKLIEPYQIVIHGGIDGYTRLVVYLKASTNNKANTVLCLFHKAIGPMAYHHVFSLIREWKMSKLPAL